MIFDQFYEIISLACTSQNEVMFCIHKNTFNAIIDGKVEEKEVTAEANSLNEKTSESNNRSPNRSR